MVRDVGISYDVKDAAFTLQSPKHKSNINHNNLNNMTFTSDENNMKRMLAVSSSAAAAALDKSIFLSSTQRAKTCQNIV